MKRPTGKAMARIPRRLQLIRDSDSWAYAANSRRMTVRTASCCSSEYWFSLSEWIKVNEPLQWHDFDCVIESIATFPETDHEDFEQS